MGMEAVKWRAEGGKQEQHIEKAIGRETRIHFQGTLSAYRTGCGNEDARYRDWTGDLSQHFCLIIQLEPGWGTRGHLPHACFLYIPHWLTKRGYTSR